MLPLGVDVVEREEHLPQIAVVRRKRLPNFSFGDQRPIALQPFGDVDCHVSGRPGAVKKRQSQRTMGRDDEARAAAAARA